jgi:hypothetical protein
MCHAVITCLVMVLALQTVGFVFGRHRIRIPTGSVSYPYQDLMYSLHEANLSTCLVSETSEQISINFSSRDVHQTALWPIQSPIQWVPRVKRPGREVDHSPLSIAEAKNELSYTSTPPIRLHGVVLSVKKACMPYLYLYRPNETHV